MNIPSHPFTVSCQPHGKRIDIFLAETFPAFSRSQLTQWLKQGKILLNQQTVKPKDKVFGGENILFLVDNTSLENKVASCVPEPLPLDIIFEDEELLVINKPAGLVVHPGAGNPNQTLVNALLYHCSSLTKIPRAGIIHRLDKDTTGLLVVAKTLSSHTHLIRQMQARQIKRNYLALVQGHVISGGEINTHYGRHPKNRLKMAVCPQGREAITLYSVQKKYEDFTLLNVQLLTGRTHQIRVHMAHIKHPVVGDPLYGGRIRFPKTASPELLALLQQFKRQALHAKKLSFFHPQTHELLTFEAKLPNDLVLLLDLLE